MRLLVVIILGTMVVGCSKTPTNETVDLGYDYFPNHIGATWIYHVDSIVYDDNSGHTKIDTFTYEYKEQIVSNYTDAAGNVGQLINRFYKMHDTLPWTQANSWQMLRTQLNAQKVEENIRYIKLVFPLEKYKKWDGNMYNAFGTDSIENDDYECTQFDEQITVGTIPYLHALTVLQQDELNFVEEIKHAETYAKYYGLVHLLSDSLNTQTDFNVNPPVEKTRGYRYRLTLKSFTQ